MHHKSFLIILLLISSLFSLRAQILSDEATLSLLSCSPGTAAYYHYGHSAIRVHDPHYTAPNGQEMPIDWTFNYGVFDFRQKAFYVKFVNGETDYLLNVEPTPDFVNASVWAGRQVYYQPLNLTQEQKQAILDALILNYQPEHRMYRYNFVYDNCATRPWRIIRMALQLPKAEGMAGRSWRDNIDFFSGQYTWLKFGINLVFGYEADREMTREQSLFLPENLMNYVSEQGLTDDEFIQPFTPRNGSFWTSPELVVLFICLLLFAFTAFDVWRKKQTWVIDGVLFLLYFIAGCILTYLYCFSEHPFVGSNLNVLYLNPLWIILFVLCFTEKGRSAILRIAPLLSLWLVVALMWMLLRHQSLHLMLALVFLHTCRLAFINKKR